jgi:hypothetical protein
MTIAAARSEAALRAASPGPVHPQENPADFGDSAYTHGVNGA